MRVVDYVVVDDCGVMLNPMVVDGQMHGGIAHGIGNAILEEAVYNEDGQFLTWTFMDYLLPTAADVPELRVLHDEHPSPLNPLGVKGVGEGGTVSPPAAIANAICDAPRPADIRITQMPIVPDRLFGWIREASSHQDT